MQPKYYEPKDPAVERLLGANADSVVKRGFKVVSPNVHGVDDDEGGVEGEEVEEVSGSSPAFEDVGGVVDMHAENVRGVVRLAENTTNLLEFLEGEMEVDPVEVARRSTTRDRMMRAFEQMQEAPVASLLETFELNPHHELPEVLDERNREMEEENGEIQDFKSISKLVGSVATKKTAAGEMTKAFSVTQDALTTAHRIIRELKKQVEDLKLKLTLNNVTEVKSKVRMSLASPAVTKSRSKSLWNTSDTPDASGPVTTSDMFIVTGVIKGPSLTTLWRREGTTMFESYTKAQQVVLQAATQTNGWVMHTTALQGFTILFETAITAFSFCSLVHENLLKVAWGLHLLKFPEYKPFTEKKSGGKDTVTVWRGLRMAMGVHATPPKTPHCDTNPLTNRTEYGSYDFMTAQGLAELARGGESVASHAAWVKATVGNPALKIAMSTKTVTLRSEEELPVGMPGDHNSYTVHRVLPLSLTHRMKHLAKLPHAAELHDTIPTTISLQTNKIKDHLMKPVTGSGRGVTAHSDGNTHSEMQSHLLGVNTSSVQNTEAIRKSEGEENIQTIAVLTVPMLWRMVEMDKDGACAALGRVVETAKTAAEHQGCNGVLFESGRDEAVFWFPSPQSALHWANALHLNLLDTPVPKTLTKFWFAGRDPLHLDHSQWTGMVATIGIHTGPITIDRPPTGFLTVRGSGRIYTTALAGMARGGETLISIQAVERLPNPHPFTLKLMCDLSTLKPVNRFYQILPGKLAKRDEVLGRLHLHKIWKLKEIYESLHPSVGVEENENVYQQEEGDTVEEEVVGEEKEEVEEEEEEEETVGVVEANEKNTQTNFEDAASLRDKSSLPLFSTRAQEILVRKAQETGLPVVHIVRPVLNVMLKLFSSDKSALRKVIDSSLSSMFRLFSVHITELKRDVFSLKEQLKAAKRRPPTDHLNADTKRAPTTPLREVVKMSTASVAGEEDEVGKKPIVESWVKVGRVVQDGTEDLMEMQKKIGVVATVIGKRELLHRDRRDALQAVRDLAELMSECGVANVTAALSTLDKAVGSAAVKAAAEPPSAILANVMKNFRGFAQTAKPILPPSSTPVDTDTGVLLPPPPPPPPPAPVLESIQTPSMVDARSPPVEVAVGGVYKWESSPGSGVRTPVTVKMIKGDTVTVTPQGGFKLFTVKLEELSKPTSPVVAAAGGVVPVHVPVPPSVKPPPVLLEQRVDAMPAKHPPPRHYQVPPTWDTDLINAMLMSHQKQRHQASEELPNTATRRVMRPPPRLPSITPKQPAVDYDSPLLIVQRGRQPSIVS